MAYHSLCLQIKLLRLLLDLQTEQVGEREALCIYVLLVLVHSHDICGRLERTLPSHSARGGYIYLFCNGV